jgi:hypothetical protein
MAGIGWGCNDICSLLVVLTTSSPQYLIFLSLASLALRQQYAMRRRRTTVHEKVLYSRERGNVRDRLDIRAASRTNNMIEDAAQAPLSVAR